MSGDSQSFSVEVEAGMSVCVSVLLDFPRYPNWSGPIQSCRVLEVDAAGRGRIVEFVLDVKIRSVRYVLEYAYDLGGDDKPSSATWSLVEGDVAGIAGSYRFESLGKGRSRATCSQTVDLGFWIPGPLRRIFERQALRDSVMEFKAEAERLATG
jgi:hypothetical protein